MTIRRSFRSGQRRTCCSPRQAYGAPSRRRPFRPARRALTRARHRLCKAKLRRRSSTLLLVRTIQRPPRRHRHMHAQCCGLPNLVKPRRGLHRRSARNSIHHNRGNRRSRRRSARSPRGDSLNRTHPKRQGTGAKRRHPRIVRRHRCQQRLVRLIVFGRIGEVKLHRTAGHGPRRGFDGNRHGQVLLRLNLRPGYAQLRRSWRQRSACPIRGQLVGIDAAEPGRKVVAGPRRVADHSA